MSVPSRLVRRTLALTNSMRLAVRIDASPPTMLTKRFGSSKQGVMLVKFRVVSSVTSKVQPWLTNIIALHSFNTTTRTDGTLVQTNRLPSSKPTSATIGAAGKAVSKICSSFVRVRTATFRHSLCSPAGSKPPRLNSTVSTHPNSNPKCNKRITVHEHLIRNLSILHDPI